MARRDHQAHRLRPELNLWCGGTQPPTEIEVDYRKNELTVLVYDDNYSPDHGQLALPQEKVQFLTPENYFAEAESVGGYALRALESIESGRYHLVDAIKDKHIRE